MTQMLTPRQQQVYTFIEEQIRTHGYPPTIREIASALDIRSTNGVADHLKALKRKGYLEQEDMKSRTVRPVPRSATSLPNAVNRDAEQISVPILGRVAAGEPILAEEQALGTVVVDSLLLGRNRKVFALKVVGESMVEDGIFDGDFIFVTKRSMAESGEIVVVMIDNEATVKRFYPEGDRIRLQPANSRMKAIYVRRDDFSDLQIIGVVVGVYRKLH